MTASASSKQGDGTPRAAKVLVVDDHPIILQTLAQFIEQVDDLQWCGGCSTTADALRFMAKTSPDVVIVDLSLGDNSGIEFIKVIHQKHPHVAVLVLSMHDETYYAERALRAGAKGYVMKHEATEVILDAIRQVLRGDVYLSERMATRLLARAVGASTSAPERPLEGLSDRELEIFELIGRGLGTGQIARKLHLSVKTIETHRANIKEKLKVGTACELLQRAMCWVQNNGASV
jgi:DNA-binding NarL/FixJ family response regulator